MKDPITSATVLLANTYASSGEIEKASNIRLQCYRKSGAKKKVGVSRTVVKWRILCKSSTFYNAMYK